ncbi:MAG: potassium channel protein [Gudongella sp.]|nr:potassium channel protein [Gudongella sp.]
MNHKGNVLIFIYILLGIVALGTIGYQVFLDVSFVDAFYMTIITISTVGYTEVAKMDVDAKLFSVFLIIISLGSVGYLFTRIISSLMEGDVRDAIRRRIMEKKIAGFKDHYILCGAGETGWNAMKRFQKSNVDFVIIEQDEEIIKELIDMGIPALKGDATQDEILINAGIHSAKGLIAALSKDADNVFTVLTARELNKNLYIVSRAIDKSAHQKLKIAGANNTISPDEIGGNRMAALMLNPTVISFLDIVTHAGDVVLDLEDVVICENSSIADMTLREIKIPEKTGLIVLAIKKNDSKKLEFNPSSDETLKIGDTMIVLGKQEQVFELRKLACDKGKREL